MPSLPDWRERSAVFPGRLVIWMMAPIASLGALFAFDAVRLVIGGSVEDAGAAATSDLLRILLVGLVAHGDAAAHHVAGNRLRDLIRPTGTVAAGFEAVAIGQRLKCRRIAVVESPAVFRDGDLAGRNEIKAIVA